MTAQLPFYFLGGVVFSEFVGYWLHQLMHSERLLFLSRGHMIHHLRIYGPVMKQRHPGEYRYATQGRVNLGGIGLEWLLPVGLLVVVLYATFAVLGWTWLEATTFTVGGLIYSYFLFWYMHNAMHQQDFWMTKVPGLGRWFLSARRRHAVHHVHLNADGQMDCNFGICFSFWDRVFGTLLDRAGGVDPAVLKRAHERYAVILVPSQERKPSSRIAG